ncbi:MAG TPA: RnfABCDGE type electron transport complex subunit D [Candidatus Bathyarchaeia archaeon]|nr:RnfABCDGE type electron transport complex subunit D [Candidatus Bathyarchaeia archaeon]
MSKESSNDLVVKSAPHITGTMTKTRLMLYTFVALLIITVVTAVLWWPVTTPTEGQIAAFKLTNVWALPLGLIVLINAGIAVGISVGIDAALHKVTADSELNTMSAAVFGLIVTLSYSLGVPAMTTGSDVLPVASLSAPGAFFYVAVISLIGLVLFKKLAGLAGRKYVNPAATAKLIVLLPFIASIFLAKEHFASYTEGGLSLPLLAGPLGWGTAPNFLAIGNNGLASFATYLAGSYANPAVTTPVATPDNISSLLILTKFHGWTGGASSLAVIIVGIGLFVVARKYIKWRITLAYFLSIAVMSMIMSTVYADQDLLLRLLFEVFIGSSIFLGFFMATDPATTPFTGIGQIIFGVGLGVLTVVIQTYMNFFGGSLLALIIMNLTVPLIDRVGIHKPFGR